MATGGDGPMSCAGEWVADLEGRGDPCGIITSCGVAFKMARALRAV